MQHLLFSYGTLQLEKVQLESFGRILNGEKDVLRGYQISTLEIKDKNVLEQSRQAFHPIAILTGNPKDKIEGVVFEISTEELLQADAYEVDDYKRVAAPLDSGKKAWVYVAKEKA